MVKMPRLSIARSIFCDFTIGAMVTAIYLGESAITCKNKHGTPLFHPRPRVPANAGGVGASKAGSKFLDISMIASFVYNHCRNDLLITFHRE